MIERIPTRCLVEYRRWRKRTAGHSSKGVALGYSDHRLWRTNPWPKAIFNAVPGRAKHPKVFGQGPYAIHSQRVGARVGDLYNVEPMTQHGFFGAIRSSASSNLFHDVDKFIRFNPSFSDNLRWQLVRTAWGAIATVNFFVSNARQ